ASGDNEQRPVAPSPSFGVSATPLRPPISPRELFQGAAQMKVLHVLPYPGVGGTEVATRRIADATRPLGVHSTALLLSPTADQIDYFEAAGIPCIEVEPRPEPSLVREATRFFRESWRIARICADYDIVHCADTAAAYHIAAAGRLARRPVLC